MANNLVIGRGELHFDRFAPGTRNKTGERYIGNTPEFNLTIESESLDHFDSDHGIREKDDSVILETNRTGSFITDNINPDNMALFFFGEVNAFTVSSATVDSEAIDGVVPGMSYQLGVSTQNPVGALDLAVHTAGPPDVNIIVKDDTSPVAVEYDEGVDYTVDMTLGRITIVEGGAITKGKNLRVSYKTKSGTRDRMISGSQAVEGALRYIEFNPVGSNGVWVFPYVKLGPNGDLALKSEEWQQLPFTVEVLKLSNQSAIYRDSMPYSV